MFNSESNVMNVKKKMNCLKLISDLSNEEEKFREFIKCFIKDTAKATSGCYVLRQTTS